MTLIQEIYNDYTELRARGRDAKSALDSLRAKVEGLAKPERTELANMLRMWETRKDDTPMPIPAPVTPLAKQSGSPIRPIKPIAAARSTVTVPVVEVAAPAPIGDWVVCPNCGKSSQKTEVFCYACGQLLEPITMGETRHFEAGDSAALNSEYYGTDSDTGNAGAWFDGCV